MGYTDGEVVLGCKAQGTLPVVVQSLQSGSRASQINTTNFLFNVQRHEPQEDMFHLNNDILPQARIASRSSLNVKWILYNVQLPMFL